MIEAGEGGYDPRRVEERRDQFVMITGCSGSGKSTLLAELARRGFQTFAEPGRQIVKEQLHIGGDALPWANAQKFIDHVIVRAMHQMTLASASERLAVFDRGIVDAAAAFDTMGIPLPPHYAAALRLYRYNPAVFLSQPWPEIFGNDAERRHSFDDALAEHAVLERVYARNGYHLVPLPKLDVAKRADFIVETLGSLAQRR